VKFEVPVDRPRRHVLTGGLDEAAVIRPRLPHVARPVTFTADACAKCENVLRCHRDRLCWRAEEAAMGWERRAR
jgi:hypothetical protein